jgi:hypothetical protein
MKVEQALMQPVALNLEVNHQNTVDEMTGNW